MKRLEFGRWLRAYRRKLYDRHRSLWMHRPLDSTLESDPPCFDARLVLDEPDRVLDFIRDLDVPGTFDPEEIRSLRQRGHLVAGLRAGDEWVGFSKLGWGCVYVLDYRIDLVLPAGAFFVLDSYVRPEWRRRGAGRFLLTATSAAMRDRGFTTRVSHIQIDNKAMLALGARSGYRELGAVDYRAVLGRKRFRPHPQVLLAQALDSARRAQRSTTIGPPSCGAAPDPAEVAAALACSAAASRSSIVTRV